MSVVKIRCQVLPGIFQTEYYVLVNGSSGYYVSTSNVEVASAVTADRPVDGSVRGYLIAEADDKALVQLPGEAMVGSLRTWVEKKYVSLSA